MIIETDDGSTINTHRKFDASQFVATKYDSAEQKAKFANQFVRWVLSDFKETLFPKWFYQRLSMAFGHIAHYNQRGFYDTFANTTRDKIRFLQITAKNHLGGGSPEFTYSDVEKELQTWVIESGLIEKYVAIQNRNVEAAERAMLADLKRKYEGAA